MKPSPGQLVVIEMAPVARAVNGWEPTFTLGRVVDPVEPGVDPPTSDENTMWWVLMYLPDGNVFRQQYRASEIVGQYAGPDPETLQYQQARY